MNIRDGYIKKANYMVEMDTEKSLDIETIVKKAEDAFWDVIVKEIGMEDVSMSEEDIWNRDIHPRIVSFISDYVRNS